MLDIQNRFFLIKAFIIQKKKWKSTDEARKLKLDHLISFQKEHV